MNNVKMLLAIKQILKIATTNSPIVDIQAEMNAVRQAVAEASILSAT